MKKLVCILVFFNLLACSSVPKPSESYQKYITPPGNIVKETKSSNSLFDNRGSLFEDPKARRLNDLVTIKVIENISGTNDAQTNTSRDSQANYGIDSLFGMNLDFNLQNAFLLKDFYKSGNTFAPVTKGNAKSEFKGKGDTQRSGKLVGTITAKVIEVLPNGNLVIESRKEIVINNEKQILSVKGIIRPEDVEADNTIFSYKVADAQIYYSGEGVIGEKQRPGWLARFLDTIWPF